MLHYFSMLLPQALIDLKATQDDYITQLTTPPISGGFLPLPVHIEPPIENLHTFNTPSHSKRQALQFTVPSSLISISAENHGLVCASRVPPGCE